MGLDSQPLLSEIKSFLQEKSSVPEEKPIKISGTFLFVVGIIIIILIGGGSSVLV